MRSIPLAMTWEMFSRGRWSLIAAALGANVFPALILTAVRHEGTIDPEDSSQLVMHMVLVQISMFCFAAAAFAAQGEPSRLYAFPVPTSSLVAWKMLPAMVLVSLETLVSSAALNVVFDLNWPLWGPALFVAVAVAAIQATLWLTEKSAWLPWAFALVATVLGLWLKSRYGETFSQPNRLWSEVTPSDVVTMLSFALLSYFVAVIGVARQRRGDVLPSLGILAWLERTFDSAPEVGQPFRTPAQAQFWFEWRQKGWAMPAAVLFGIVGGCGGWLIFSRDCQELLHGFFVGGGLLSVVGLVGAMILGNTGPSDANFEMGQFLATRPLTNVEMSRMILKTAAKSVFLAWSIWAVAFLTLYMILLAFQAVPPNAFPSELIGWGWYFPATLLGPWIVVGLLGSVGLAGRPRTAWKLFAALFLLIIARPLFAKYALSYQAQLQFDRGMTIALGVVYVLGTAWAFVAARRRSLIGSRTTWTALSTWATLSVLVVLERALHRPNDVPLCVFTVGLLASATATLATAPLALAWNRNR